MQKTILPETPATGHADAWIDLESVADVEVTSEDPAFPVENALLAGRTGGWHAEAAGAQTIRLRFVNPLPLRRIRLLFVEDETARTQEFTLRWAGPDGVLREIVRQQYNFSPPHTTRQVEAYQVELDGVSALELAVIPNVGGGAAKATLEELRLE